MSADTKFRTEEPRRGVDSHDPCLDRREGLNRLYLVAAPEEGEQHAPEPEPRPEPLDTLSAALRVTHAQQLAVDHGIDRQRLHHQLEGLHYERSRLEQIEQATPRDASRDIAALERSRTGLHADLDRQHEQLAALQGRRPLRHRRDHAAEQILATQRVERLTRRLDETDRALAASLDQQAQRDTYLATHHADFARLGDIQHEIGARLDQLVASYRNDPPAYLADLGPCPTDINRRAHWTDAARDIEDYRHRNHITDPRRPFGPAEHNNHRQQHAREQLDHALDHITPQRGTEPHNLGLGL